MIVRSQEHMREMAKLQSWRVHTWLNLRQKRITRIKHLAQNDIPEQLKSVRVHSWQRNNPQHLAACDETPLMIAESTFIQSVMRKWSSCSDTTQPPCLNDIMNKLLIKLNYLSKLFLLSFEYGGLDYN